MYILVTGYSKMQDCVILRKKAALHHGTPQPLTALSIAQIFYTEPAIKECCFVFVKLDGRI